MHPQIAIFFLVLAWPTASGAGRGDEEKEEKEEEEVQEEEDKENELQFWCTFVKI